MNDDASPPVLPALSAMADPQRLRLLRLLDIEELSVGELAAAAAMTQSSVSRHVALLRRAGLVEERAEGVRTYLRLAAPPPAQVRPLLDAVLTTVRGEGFGSPADLRRLDEVRRAREAGRERMFDSLAADWDALRAEVLGGALSAPEIASLLSPEGLRVVDAGCGTGVHLRWLSAVAGPRGRVVGVEPSAAMVARARERVAGCGNVEVRRGRIEDLPVRGGWADALVLSLSLGQTSDPETALRRCAKAVRPGGRVVVADVRAHGDRMLVERLGSGFRGFEPEALLAAMRRASLRDVRVVECAPEGVGSSERPARPSRPRTRGFRPLEPLLAVGTVPIRRTKKRRTRP